MNGEGTTRIQIEWIQRSVWIAGLQSIGGVEVRNLDLILDLALKSCNPNF